MESWHSGGISDLLHLHYLKELINKETEYTAQTWVSSHCLMVLNPTFNNISLISWRYIIVCPTYIKYKRLDMICFQALFNCLPYLYMWVDIWIQFVSFIFWFPILNSESLIFITVVYKLSEILIIHVIIRVIIILNTIVICTTYYY
jgi:hypothetical protein